MFHLTHTGYSAGALLCGKPRDEDGKYWHAVYAPLHDEARRSEVCPDCLREYANAAYDDEDAANDLIPAWALALRD